MKTVIAIALLALFVIAGCSWLKVVANPEIDKLVLEKADVQKRFEGAREDFLAGKIDAEAAYAIMKDTIAQIKDIDEKLDVLKAEDEAKGTNVPKPIYWLVTIGSLIANAVIGKEWMAVKAGLNSLVGIVQSKRKKGSVESVVTDCAKLGNKKINKAAKKLP